MALVLFKKVSNSTVPTEAIENGKLLYDYQSKKIFLDEGGVRVAFYDFIGLLTSLTTTAKDTIVNAINELVTKTNTTNTNVGALADLTTSVKTSIVGAINWVVTQIVALSSSIGNLSSLTTTVKTSIVGAINWMMGVLLPQTTAVSVVLTKPTNPVYGQTYRYYFVPCRYADLYTISGLSVTVIGLGGITGVSVIAQYPNGFLVVDTVEVGKDYPIQINATLTKI